jgi:DNA-binding MltR family transcriptional regulator
MAAKKAPGMEALEELHGLTSIDSKRLEKAMNDETRIQVLNLDALLDEILRNLLERNFSRPQDDAEIEHLFNIQFGPLSSLSNKARLAYVLGLINKTTCNDLKKAHDIRNEFAHGLETDFACPEVVKLVKEWCKGAGTRKRVTTKNSYYVYVAVMSECLSDVVKALEQDNDKIATQGKYGKKYQNRKETKDHPKTT